VIGSAALAFGSPTGLTGTAAVTARAAQQHVTPDRHGHDDQYGGLFGRSDSASPLLRPASTAPASSPMLLDPLPPVTVAADAASAVPDRAAAAAAASPAAGPTAPAAHTAGLTEGSDEAEVSAENEEGSQSGESPAGGEGAGNGRESAGDAAAGEAWEGTGISDMFSTLPPTPETGAGAGNGDSFSSDALCSPLPPPPPLTPPATPQLTPEEVAALAAARENAAALRGDPGRQLTSSSPFQLIVHH